MNCHREGPPNGDEVISQQITLLVIVGIASTGKERRFRNDN
jgi:hypothetical protein